MTSSSGAITLPCDTEPDGDANGNGYADGRISKNKQKLAEARKGERAHRTSNLDDLADEITGRFEVALDELKSEVREVRQTQLSAPELQVEGKFGKLRIAGLSGGYLVLAIFGLAVMAGLVVAAWLVA